MKLKYKKDPNAFDINRNNAKFIVLLLIWPMIHFCVFWIYVNISTVVNSFFSYKIDGSREFSGIEPYIRAFTDILFNKESANIQNYRAIKNVFSIIIIGVFVDLPIMIIFSYLMYKKVLGSKVFRIVLFTPAVISTVVLCLIFSSIVAPGGPFDLFLKAIGLGGDGTPADTGIIPVSGWLADPKTAWPTILVFSVFAGISGYLIYFSSTIGRLPQELFESAELDGASELRQFFCIVIPLIWPVITTLTVTSVGSSFGWMMPSLLMTGTTNKYTTTFGLIIVNSAKSGVINSTICALGVIIAIFGGAFTFIVKVLMEKVYEEVQY